MQLLISKDPRIRLTSSSLVKVLGSAGCVKPKFAANCLTTAMVTSRPAGPENLFKTLCDWAPLLFAAIMGDRDAHSANIFLSSNLEIHVDFTLCNKYKIRTIAQFCVTGGTPELKGQRPTGILLSL